MARLHSDSGFSQEAFKSQSGSTRAWMPFTDLNGTKSSDCLLRLRRTHRENGSDSWRIMSRQVNATAFLPFIRNCRKYGHPCSTSKRLIGKVLSCMEADRAVRTRHVKRTAAAGIEGARIRTRRRSGEGKKGKPSPFPLESECPQIQADAT